VRRDNIDREPSMSQLTEKTIFDQHCISARAIAGPIATGKMVAVYD
jgi:hypothetical protein